MQYNLCILINHILQQLFGDVLNSVLKAWQLNEMYMYSK